MKRQPLAVAREELVEPRLVDRDLAGAQRVDLRRDDVADDDVVAELGEARAGDETDVAGAEDGDLSRREPTYLLLPSGLRPLAIASIVSFESRSRSVLTTQ